MGPSFLYLQDGLEIYLVSSVVSVKDNKQGVLGTY